jgi:septal ring factor EnvC (AmiA/AmiB activator)
VRAAIAYEIAKARKEAEERERIAAAKARAANKPAAVVSEKAKTSSGYLTATPEAAKLSNGFESNRGRLPWPVGQGSITEHFGQHMEGQASYSNDGVDIMTSEGATVKAIFGGEVRFVKMIQGIYVVGLRHGDYFTVYQNLKSVNVSGGDKVSTGESLGVVATRNDGPLLHLEIWRGQSRLNPEAWIAR